MNISYCGSVSAGSAQRHEEHHSAAKLSFTICPSEGADADHEC